MLNRTNPKFMDRNNEAFVWKLLIARLTCLPVRFVLCVIIAFCAFKADSSGQELAQVFVEEPSASVAKPKRKQVSDNQQTEQDAPRNDGELILAQEGLRKSIVSGITSGVLPGNKNADKNFPTTNQVKASYYQWFDSSRGRNIPAKVFVPNNVDKPCPVILFSHGLGGSMESCGYLGEYWAVNGYISVHIQHQGSDDSVWRGKLRPLNELRSAYEINWTGRSRVMDILFVLDQLDSLSKRNAGSKDAISNLLDMDRIGIAGYDLGAYAAMIMAGQLAPEKYPIINDPRIKAIVAMSPPVQPISAPTSEVYSKIEIPCFFITGTADDGIVGSTRAVQRRIPFDAITCNDQYLVTFDGTDHMVYAGHLFSNAGRDDAPIQRVIARLSTNFLNAYVKEDPNAVSFMMSRNLVGLLGGTGRVERKFYVRENVSVAMGQDDSEKESVGASQYPSPILTNSNQSYSANRQTLRNLNDTVNANPKTFPRRLQKME